MFNYISRTFYKEEFTRKFSQIHKGNYDALFKTKKITSMDQFLFQNLYCQLISEHFGHI